MLSYIIGGLVVLAVLYFAARHFGVLGKLDDTARLKVNQGVDGLTTAVEKKKMQISKLKQLLDQQADAVTDLDASVGTAVDEMNDAKKALDSAVQDLQDMQTASPNDTTAIGNLASAVATAEALFNTKKGLVDSLKVQATQVHEDYADSLKVFEQRQNELPAAEATATLTRALRIKASIGKQNEAFKNAAAMGDDADKQLRTELHKAEAEANMHAGKTDEQRKLEEIRANRTTADILARYGKPGATPAPAAPTTPPAGDQK